MYPLVLTFTDSSVLAATSSSYVYDDVLPLTVIVSMTVPVALFDTCIWASVCSEESAELCVHWMYASPSTM